jgi:TonB-linked SusC/RagA family outer membrane protein
MIPVRLPNGEFSGPPTGNFADVQNPLQVLTLNRHDQHKDLNVFGNVFLDFNLTDNILLSTHAGLDWDNRKDRDIQRRYQSGFMQRDPNVLSRADIRRRQLTFNQTIEYSTDIGSSNINALVGGEIVDETFETFRARSSDFEVQTLDYMVENASVGTRNASGTESEWTLLSGFSKVDYSYQNKYLFSGTLRYDGSSKLGAESRWGLFPAISAGWRLGREAFIQDNLSFLSRLKVRAEWGKTGNQDIDPEAQFTLFRANYGGEDVLTPPWARGYNFGFNGTAYDIEGNNTGSLPSGFIQTQTGNEDLKWEEATEVNVGVDFGLLDNRITGSIDYFNRQNEDILIQPPFLAVLGEGGDQFVNGATVETNGLEFTATYDDKVGNFDYSVTGNFATINDKITKLPQDVVDAFPGNREKTILGQSQNSIFGYVADGIFDSQEEVENHAEQQGAAPGRLRYKDLNGDGEITPLDQKYLGTSTPDYEFGLNMAASYKSFDLRIFFQGVYGVTVIDDRKAQTDFTSLWSGTNYGRRTLDAWTPQNKDSSIPALTLQDTNDEGRMSTYFAANGRYLKLRNVTLGYTFGQFIPYAKRARVFVSAANILEFHDEDSFTSPDPEFPTEGGFPRPREFTMGINLSF